MPEYKEVPKSLSRISDANKNGNSDFDDFELTPPEVLFKDLASVEETRIELVHPDKLFGKPGSSSGKNGTRLSENKKYPHKKEGKNKEK